MKTNLRKIISMLIAAAIVLSSGFTAIPKPSTVSDSAITIIEIEPDSDDGNCGNEYKPLFDDSPDEISQ